jgi:hypothetical protein
MPQNDGINIGKVGTIRHSSKTNCPIEVDYTTDEKILIRILHNGEKTVVTVELEGRHSRALRSLLRQAEAHI